MSQYIYIGSTELEKANNFFKIGKTKQPIEKRIKQYQTGRSELTKFILLDYFPCHDCGYIEYLLKIKLKNFHHKNEIYKIDYDKLKSIIEETIELEDITEDETDTESDDSNDSDSDYIPDSEYETILETKKLKIKKDLLFEKEHLESIFDYLFNRIDSDLDLYFKTKRNRFYYKTNILKNINELETITMEIKRNILDIFRTNTIDKYNNSSKNSDEENEDTAEKNVETVKPSYVNKKSIINKISIIDKIMLMSISIFIAIVFYFIFY